jgi:hypothetical protein
MSERDATQRISTHRRETGRLTPRRFSRPAWYRFSRERRRRYLDQIALPPTDAQAARIETMVRLEWAALKAEAEGSLQGDREAREHRRLYDRLLGDHQRSVAARAEKPPQRQTGYRTHVAQRHEPRA